MALTKTGASILIGIFYILTCNIAESQKVNFAKPSTDGLCTLEVPTIDLLSQADRQGVIPPGNGTKPGFSKIHICCSGWRLQPHTAFHCVPECDKDCVNGNCTAPNVCTCYPDYIFDLDYNCVPTCPKGCLNGVCSNNGQCSCYSGYKLDPKGKMCIPQCTGGCGTGGNCTAPEACSCKPGLTKNPSTGKCEHFCEGGCQGGECVAPNQCSCKPGYLKKNNVCEPQCATGCRNGACVAPNKCSCQSGYTLNTAGTLCEAQCLEPCLNGVCSGPNTCTCNDGYIKDVSRPSLCVAHCPNGCENGQCSAPNFCICNPGFIKQKGTNKCVTRTRRAALHLELLRENNY